MGVFKSIFIVFIIAIIPQQSFGLTCKDVKNLTGAYLKMHYLFKTFNDELSKRTLNLLIKSWDPDKLYFYKSDIEKIKKQYSTTIDDQIKLNKCDVVSDIIKIYGKRFDEIQKIIPNLINKKFDFNKDEYLNFDRKKTKFASTTEELMERWRKRVKFQILQLKTSLKGDIKKAQEKLKERYKRLIKHHNEKSLDDAYSDFLNSFALSLDPHSSYMPSDQLEDFRIATRLSLEGIGALLRSEDGFTIIQRIIPGGAAAKTGKLKAKDKIIAVGQGLDTPIDVFDMDLRDVVKLIRGPGGTEVRLTVLREKAGKTKQLIIPIIREKIQLNDRSAKSKVYKLYVKNKKQKTPLKIGVLNLPSFYIDFEGMHKNLKDFKSSSRDVLKELTKLEAKRVDAIIIDLRTNGGGGLGESITIAGLFKDKGPVVQIKEENGAIHVNEDKDGITYYKGPLIVLTSRQSASASEIFAGAIQDWGRGIIVGDKHTFGKGTVQNLNDIGNDRGAIKVTISKFYRPSGASTQLKGVASDVVLPNLMDELEIGEKFYDYALPWDTIKAAKYNYNSTIKTKYLAKIKKRSTMRLKKDKAFLNVFDEIKKYKDKKGKRMQVSLKEEKSKKNNGKDEEDYDPYAELRLKDDIYLQETLRIAADYVQLKNNKQLGTIIIPSLEKDLKKADKKITLNKKKIKLPKTTKPKKK